jgi:hypothetical protein
MEGMNVSDRPTVWHKTAVGPKDYVIFSMKTVGCSLAELKGAAARGGHSLVPDAKTPSHWGDEAWCREHLKTYHGWSEATFQGWERGKGIDYGHSMEHDWQDDPESDHPCGTMGLGVAVPHTHFPMEAVQAILEVADFEVNQDVRKILMGLLELFNDGVQLFD